MLDEIIPPIEPQILFIQVVATMAAVPLMKTCVILLAYLASGYHDTLAKCKPRKDACPSDWTLWGGSCYKATAGELDWSGAGAECERMGGKMAAPKTLDESLFMSSLAQDIWINCNDMQTEGEWNCIDGVTATLYRNWSKNEPNDDGLEGEDCVYMPKDNGNWLDIPCHMLHQAVCKQPIQQKTL